MIKQLLLASILALSFSLAGCEQGGEGGDAGTTGDTGTEIASPAPEGGMETQGETPEAGTATEGATDSH